MAETAKTNRPNRSEKKRVPLGARNRLSFQNLDPEFKYRVINDTDDRLVRAQEAGYEFVESDDRLGDVRVAEGSVPGSKVAKPVGNGMTGYLMRIPKEYYQEDQKTKSDKVDQLEKSMTPDKNRDQYGEGLENK